MAVGLIDGSLILVDLILGMEKRFLEKHPAEISALAFWDDKVLISGSIDGRVNISDLEDEPIVNPAAPRTLSLDDTPSKVNRCQNA